MRDIKEINTYLLAEKDVQQASMCVVTLVI